MKHFIFDGNYWRKTSYKKTALAEALQQERCCVNTCEWEVAAPPHTHTHTHSTEGHAGCVARAWDLNVLCAFQGFINVCEMCFCTINVKFCQEKFNRICTESKDSFPTNVETKQKFAGLQQFVSLTVSLSVIFVISNKKQKATTH